MVNASSGKQERSRGRRSGCYISHLSGATASSITTAALQRRGRGKQRRRKIANSAAAAGAARPPPNHPSYVGADAGSHCGTMPRNAERSRYRRSHRSCYPDISTIYAHIEARTHIGRVLTHFLRVKRKKAD